MNIHFIAIGGSAMHNLALALHSYGHNITGSDDEIFEPSKTRLAEKGLLPEKFGWDASRITDQLDAVILGMHARKDNPELLKAQESGIPIYSYPEFIYNHSIDKTRIAITGSHGKTTITSMILHVLNYHNVSTDYMVGALIEGFDTMVKLTDDEFIVLEGDEYLSSPIDLRPKFLHYKPNIVLLSGIAWDHVNVFPTYEEYKEQFRLMLDSIEKGGVVIYNQEDPEVVDLIMKCTNEIKKFAYGIPTYRIEDGVSLLETPDGEVPLKVFGQHNLNNLEGARWVCLEMGVQEEEFYEAISTFSGAGKRLELIGEKSNSKIFKDFAHAPSKVEATVRGTKEQ
ncbi:MAG: Mur ligase family protein, partial [Schleiferiaceae bacterium]|nr:Mur ligase family protein [Schleiferiaceae bacterium]